MAIDVSITIAPNIKPPAGNGAPASCIPGGVPIGQHRGERQQHGHALDNPEASRANRQAFVVFLQDRIQRKANTGTGNTHDELNRREEIIWPALVEIALQMIQ